MFMRISYIVATTIVLFCVYAQQPASNQLVSQPCLGCICEVTSGCNTTIGCSHSSCGPFAITSGYWSDAGKPTLNGEPASNNGAYYRCVNDVYCAALTIQNYMGRYNQDCTGDGVIDCDDYLRIHRFGGFGACTRPLNNVYEARYKLCMQIYNQ